MTAKSYAASIKQGDNSKKLTPKDVLREHNRINLNLHNEILESNRQDRLEKKLFANKIFWLLTIFLALTIGYCSAIRLLCFKFVGRCNSSASHSNIRKRSRNFRICCKVSF